VTDDIEVVQRILEGKCPDCGLKLPGHDMDCKFNPARDLTERIERLNMHLRNEMNKLHSLILQNKITIEETKQLLKELQSRKVK